MRAAALLGPLALTACALVDQRTFQPAATPPLAAEIAATTASDTRLALVTVRFDRPDPSLDATLASAAKAAMARKPAVTFDVVALLRPAPGAAAQAAALAQAQGDATAVMHGLLQGGAVADRVRLGVRMDAAAAPREVMVYVR